MSELINTKIIKLLSILIILASCAQHNDQNSFLPLNNQWVVDKEEATRWSMVKHDNLPTLTGSTEWLNYMNFLENEFIKYGVIDLFKNSWEFDRWVISEDEKNWTLSVDNKNIRVAYYGAYSGKTDLESALIVDLYN